MSERADLWRTVQWRPLDDAPKLVFADWLAERGSDPDLEVGLRWCVASRKWPRCVGLIRDDRWEWHWGPDATRSRDYLTRTLWGSAVSYPGGVGPCPLETAIRRLGRGIKLGFAAVPHLAPEPGRE